MAHGGGLDKQGCHHNRKDGGYHCHRGPLAGRSFESKGEATKVISGDEPDTFAGRASVIDGDTIEIAGRRFRLHGIDAPESGQSCTGADGETYRCGQRAALALAEKIGNSIVACKKREVDRYRRIVGVCGTSGMDLNAWMVEQGHAVAYRRYSHDYVAQEESAKRSKHGIWAGSFIPPEEWRRGSRIGVGHTQGAAELSED